MEIKIGCRGFQTSKERYYRRFDVVEIQSTFYRIPRIKTVQKWREEAPEGFAFIVKVFQGVTHPPDSPTWKRSNIMPTSERKFGLLRSSKEVLNSWSATLEVARILRSKILVLQTPSTFRDTIENIRNATAFFKQVERDSFSIAFEPRGWREESIRAVCEKHNLIHCTDPFAAAPTSLDSTGTAYFRLHGSPPGKKMYQYKYTQRDLRWLKEFLDNFNCTQAYVMFNNVEMFRDAQRFKNLVKFS